MMTPWYENAFQIICPLCGNQPITSGFPRPIRWTFEVFFVIIKPLRWRHNELDGVSDHQPHDCLLNRLFGRRSKRTSKLRVTGLCAGNSPGTGEFSAQMASNAENVSIWWRHHASYLIEKKSELLVISDVMVSRMALMWSPTNQCSEITLERGYFETCHPIYQGDTEAWAVRVICEETCLNFQSTQCLLMAWSCLMLGQCPNTHRTS